MPRPLVPDYATDTVTRVPADIGHLLAPAVAAPPDPTLMVAETLALGRQLAGAVALKNAARAEHLASQLIEKTGALADLRIAARGYVAGEKLAAPRVTRRPGRPRKAR